MEQLSIEEKAKRYDEALEKARQLCAYPTTKPFISDLQDLFPELAESKDERIRKWLICTLKSLNSTAVQIDGAYEMMLPAISWLEKQGKQKPIISDDAIREGIAHFGITQYQIDNWLKKYVDVEKQGEQKPVFEMKTPEESLGIDSDTYNKIVDECVYDEQKPADDIERKYNPCYNMSFEEAQEYISNRGFDIPWTDCDVFVDFRYVTQTVANILRWADDNPKQNHTCGEEHELSCFESALFTAFSDAWQSYLLGEKVNVKQWAKEHSKELLEAAKEELKEKKSSWSEEDEAMLNDIISDAEQGEDLDDVQINWLKSIRPQNTWKPS